MRERREKPVKDTASQMLGSMPGFSMTRRWFLSGIRGEVFQK